MNQLFEVFGLAHVESRLLSDGFRTVVLETTPVLRRALRFYEAHGYSLTGTTTDFYGMRLVHLRKDLVTASSAFTQKVRPLV